jgi:hypothetical protein
VRLAASEDVAGVTGRYFDRFADTAPSSEARDDGAAARLWEIAERATAARRNDV